jgi:rod shape-determining protein MreD
MSPYLALAILAGLTLLQVTVMPAAALAGAKPILPLLAVVSWGLLRGPLAAFGWALAAGVMLDAVSPTGFGNYTLAMLAAALVVALSHGRLFAGNVLLPALVAALATAVFVAVQLWPLLTGQWVLWERGSLAPLFAKSVALALLWLPLVFFPLKGLAGWLAGPRIDWER